MEPTTIKPGFPMSLFSNIRLFTTIGIVAMVVGLASALLVSQIGDGGSTADLPVDIPVSPVELTPTVVGENPTPVTSPTTTPLRQYSAPPAMVIDVSKRYFAVLTTDKGDIRLELFAKEAPQTVNNFIFLAREGFYDGVPFHRVTLDFVAQTGDPTGTGVGGPGYTLPVEESGRRHDAGAVAMAATQGGVLNGSQFYITYSERPHLDGRDTVFGSLVSGMEVLQQLTPQPNEEGAAASHILSVTIEESDS